MRGPPAAPLASHFNSLEEVEKPGRVKRCASYLSNPEMHLYLHFISFILQPLNDFNTMFQADESKIGYLKDEITFLLRKFMGNVVKAKIIQSTEDLTAVSFKNCQFQDNIIAVRVTSRAYMVDHADEIRPSRFFMSVRKFYEAVTSKMFPKFRGDLPQSTLTDLARRVPSLMPQDQWDQLEEEFLNFRRNSCHGPSQLY